MNLRPLNPEDIEQARIRGYTITAKTLIDDDTGDLLEPEANDAPNTTEVSHDTAGQENPITSAIKATDIPGPLGFAKRALTRAALPAAAAGKATAVSAPFTGPWSLLIGAGAGIGTAFAQNWGLKKYAEANPTSPTAEFVRKSEQDVTEHPYLSILASMPSSKLMPGGTFFPRIPSAATTSGKDIGKIMALQGAINTGAQLATKPPSEFDPSELLVSSALSPFWAGKAPVRSRTKTALDDTAIGARIKELAAGENIPEQVQPVNQRPGFDYEFYKQGDVKKLGLIKDQFTKTVLEWRKNHVDITNEMLDELAQRGPGIGYREVSNQILSKVLPPEATKQRVISEANARQQELAKQNEQQRIDAEARAKALASLTPERTTSVTPSPPGTRPMGSIDVPKISQPESTGEAARSAATILAQEPVVKEISKDAQSLMSLQRARNSIAKTLKFIPEAEQSDVLDTLARIDSQIEDLNATIAARGERIPTGARPMKIGGTEPEVPIEEPEVPIKTPVVKEPVAPPTKPEKLQELPVAKPTEQELNVPEPTQTETTEAPFPIEVGTKIATSNKTYEISGYNEKTRKVSFKGTEKYPTDIDSLIALHKAGQIRVFPPGESTTEFLAPTPTEPALPKIIPPVDVTPTVVEKPTIKPAITEAQESATSKIPKQPKTKEVKPATHVKIIRAADQAANVESIVRVAQEAKDTNVSPDIIRATVKSELAKGNLSQAQKQAVLDRVEEIIKAPPKTVKIEPGDKITTNQGVEHVVKSISKNRIMTEKDLELGGSFVEGQIQRGLWRLDKPAKVEAPAESKGLQIKAAQEAAEKKGKQAGSIINPLPEIGKGVKAIGRAIETPIRGLEAKTRSTIKRIMKKSNIGAHVGRKFEQMEIEQKQGIEPVADAVLNWAKPFSTEQRIKIGDWLKDMRDEGKSSVQLTPEEKQAALNLHYTAIAIGEQHQKEGAWVVTYGPHGERIVRPKELRPWYWASKPSKETMQKLHGELPTDERTKAQELQVKHIMDRMGLDRTEAEDVFEKMLNPSFEKGAPNPEFQGIRTEAGIGWARGLEEPDPFKTMLKYVNDSATDMAFHKNVEQDPVVAKAFGLKTDGRGNLIPEKVTLENGEEVPNAILKGDTDVDALMRHYIGLIRPDVQKSENWLHAIYSGSLQTMTQTRNIAQNLFALPGELLHPSEYRFMVKGVMDMINPEATARAIRSGSARGRRNILPSVAQDVDDNISKLSDFMSRYSGSDLLARSNDVMLDSIGRLVAKKRFMEGDMEFVKKYAPLNWKEMPPEKVIDYIAARITRQFAGSYGGEGLPPELLRGSKGLLGRYFSLQRWSVERFNRWHENVYEPAKQGNLKPLIASMVSQGIGVAVINKLTEVITNRKPKELTWSEYLHLGGKDTAYTLFSKAATAAHAGILSDLLFGMVQMYHKEMPRGFNNLAFSFAEDTATRLGQLASAFGRGDINLESLAAFGMATAQDRIQLLRDVTRKNIDQGQREEKIARRLGYLPQAGAPSATLPDPFSETEAYRKGRIGQLKQIMERKREQGVNISAPRSVVRQSHVLKEGEPVGYYDAIEAMQGKEAREAALERDKELTRKRGAMYREATSALQR